MVPVSSGIRITRRVCSFGSAGGEGDLLPALVQEANAGEAHDDGIQQFKEVFAEQAVDDDAGGIDGGDGQEDAEEMDSVMKEPIGEDDGFVVDHQRMKAVTAKGMKANIPARKVVRTLA